uniref:Solute carrier family 35 member F1 n=1 Tax=Electrophorus electricus TaxID=8005 RepID=A0AAY5EPE7_ELEEL
TAQDKPNDYEVMELMDVGAAFDGSVCMRAVDGPTTLLLTLALGQVLSLLICGIGLTSKYLATDYHANTPVFQSFLNYILLFLVYTTTLAVRQGEENLLAILKRRWWKYMILGLIDIEANYLVIKAYQYTTLTSIQLLDCFVIPVALLLSWFFLLVRYKVVHFVGVGVCLLGMGCMVGADVLVGRQQGDHKLLGDLLVLAGATLYGISNVCEEFIVKNLSRVEFLGMMGLFGSFFSGIQLRVHHHHHGNSYRIGTHLTHRPCLPLPRSLTGP